MFAIVTASVFAMMIGFEKLSRSVKMFAFGWWSVMMFAFDFQTVKRSVFVMHFAFVKPLPFLWHFAIVTVFLSLKPFGFVN